MLEPIRELLDAGVQSDKGDTDVRWSKALRDEIHGRQGGAQGQAAGDGADPARADGAATGRHRPGGDAENLLVFVEDLPTFHAKMGRTKENVALR